MKIVLDTNVLVVCLSRKSKYNFIIDLIENGTFSLIVSTEVLLEYEEIVSRKYNKEIAKIFVNSILLNKHTYKVDPHYNLNLIQSDIDDNKFVNLAFAGNANFIVTNDKHFNVLKMIDFPRINVLDLEMFINVLNSNIQP
jgi:uncharacterized protein